MMQQSATSSSLSSSSFYLTLLLLTSSIESVHAEVNVYNIVFVLLGVLFGSFIAGSAGYFIWTSAGRKNKVFQAALRNAEKEVLMDALNPKSAALVLDVLANNNIISGGSYSYEASYQHGKTVVDLTGDIQFNAITIPSSDTVPNDMDRSVSSNHESSKCLAITGSGRDPAGTFQISRGVVCIHSGRAYWIETAGTGSTRNMNTSSSSNPQDDGTAKPAESLVKGVFVKSTIPGKLLSFQQQSSKSQSQQGRSQPPPPEWRNDTGAHGKITSFTVHSHTRPSPMDNIPEGSLVGMSTPPSSHSTAAAAAAAATVAATLDHSSAAFSYDNEASENFRVPAQFHPPQ